MDSFRTVSASFLTKTMCLLGLTLGTTLSVIPEAQAEMFNLCDETESTFFIAETENYWISICGGDYPYTYVGMNKDNEDLWIRADLVEYGEDGSYFDAVNGEYTYSINLNTAKGSWLSVIDGDNEVILSEYLLDWE